MRSGDDSGAAIVEFALVVVLLLTIVFGTVELGLAFKDWLSISTASREAVRVGSAAGNLDEADCYMLEAMAGALFAVRLNDINEVIIYDAALGPSSVRRNVYRVATGDPGELLVCNDGWNKISEGWAANTRSVRAGSLDLLGVRIEFDHKWITGIGPFGGTAHWRDDAVMRLEPKQF